MVADENTVNKVKRTHEAKDIQKIIRLVLDSPISSEGPVVEIDGNKPLSSLSGKPLDVKTSLIMGITMEALATRDLKLIEFLFKYGGLEPVKEQKVALEMPTIIDDIDFTISGESTPKLPQETLPTCTIPVIDSDLGE